MSLCRVTAHLTTPVASYHPLHLDGMLAAKAFDSEHHLTRQCDASTIADPSIPIARLHLLGARCYLCTAWIWPEDAERGREHFTTRKDAEDIERRASPWQVSAGPEKARHMPVPTIESASVSWLCIGGRQGLRAALRYVHSIGMLRRQGYGAVQGWEVETLADDIPRSVVLIDSEDRAARHLPAAWATGQTEQGAYEAPYWHPARTAAARIATGTPCALHPDVLAAARNYR